MFDEDLKIEIRPIPNRNDIRKFSDKLEYYSQAHIIAPFVNPKSLKYETGLSKEDIEYLKENNFPYNINDTFKRGEAHEFWESNLIKVELGNSPLFLYPGKSFIDFVKYKYLLVSRFVYISEEEMKSGVKPQATHYIYNEDNENAYKASRLEKRNSLIKKISELSLAKKRQLVLIINNENTDNKNDDYLAVKLEEIISGPKKAELEALLLKDSTEINTLSIIKNAVRKNVLKKTRKGYFYFDVCLGLTETDVQEFLNNSENQEILLTIKDKI